MKTLGRFIRQVILESNGGSDFERLKSDIKSAKDTAAAIRTFKVIQSHVKGAKTIGEFLDNLPNGSRVWQWDEKTTMRDGVFVIKDVRLGRNRKDLSMILQKQSDGIWVSPIYFKLPGGAQGVDLLSTLIKFFVKPERFSRFNSVIQRLDLPIEISPSDVGPNYIGSILIDTTADVPDWVHPIDADTVMLLRGVDVPLFIDYAKNTLNFRESAGNLMYGVSIPDPAFGVDGIVPINMAALQQYEDQGDVTLEIHQGSDVYEVDLIKDPNTGRPVAYPKIPL